MVNKHVLSKSTFVRSCQCLKSLYLYKHNPDLRDEIDISQQRIFDRGTSVGELAQQLFPGGEDASPLTPYDYAQSVIKTKQLIDAGCKIIYEAAFQRDEVLAAMDILVFKNGLWKAYEVKSSTSVKDQFILDAALQYHVITGTIPLKDISIVHINSEYSRNGKLELNKFFETVSVLDEVNEIQSYVKEQILKAKEVIKEKEIPVKDIGEHCFSPYSCDFMGHCWKHVPEISVFTISRLTTDKKFDLYNNGILNLEDVPDEYPLSEKQRLQVNHKKSGETYINKEAIRKFVNDLQYPIGFLDFETFQQAIPQYDNLRPYQQIPFQYSLHYKKTKKSKTEHLEFLGDEKTDPREEFIVQLIKDLDRPGDILVFNKGFETGRLNEMALIFPQHEEKILKIIDRIKDLMIPFQQKHYYSPLMNGSYSIKKVLPALVPELSYGTLAIGDGGTASATFEELYFVTDQDEIATTRIQLLEYCKLDTYAMVRILEVLEKI